MPNHSPSQKVAISKANKLPASAKQGPFWAAWGSEANKHSSNVAQGAQAWLAKLHGNSKGFKLPKWEMPVHVDVDVLTPAIQTVKRSANDVWIQLPPQVRTAAPFVGVGLGSSFIVYRIQQSRLDRAHKKITKLEHEIDLIETERDDAQKMIRELRHQGAGGRGASEMEMVAAVSQATHAAAAAASAAAGAAAQCLYDPYFQHGPNGLAPRRRLPANRPQKPQ